MIDCRFNLLQVNHFIDAIQLNPLRISPMGIFDIGTQIFPTVMNNHLAQSTAL